MHELFHQWFGDYVTAESWSNLTVNESFANFSETIWAEHKYGKDEADAHNYADMQSYLRSQGASTKNLVRFYYADKEDVFDAVTYQKGGRILNMLRNYLGDAAFYKGLNIYLKTNAFKNGEAQQLRLAFEEASGQDLNWYFNQWYYGAGHPILNISYKWDEATKTETAYLKQTQDGQTFKLPMAIDIYQGGKKVRHKEWMNDKVDSISYQLTGKPDLVNVDADKILLTKKTDNKTIDEFSFQYFNAPNYLDRYEAIEAAASDQTRPQAQKILIAALKDKYYGLRIKTIRALNLTKDDVRNAAQPILISLAQTDNNTLVKAAAITALGKLKASGNMALFTQSISSESYAVQGAALNAIAQLDPAKALSLAKGLEKDNKGALTAAIMTLYTTNGNDAEWPFVYHAFTEAGIQEKFNSLKNFADMTAKVNKPEYAQQGIEELKNAGIKFKVYGAAPFIVTQLEGIKTSRTTMKDDASAKAADDAIKAVNDAK
ncbi:M1 family aminopeptidase [Mucilaginibacter sp. P25]|uniref:M1 family aminopeptidase n=1 Tax=Mucilaginibacter sp. P25 TaxID=3423945 RepID=UPI003D7BAF45